jgi:SAM-dependent methyltransferase
VTDLVARDGSPVAVYLALPAGPAPLLIHDAIPPASSILELGCGPGRLTRVLVALGHRVTAVDDSAAMLAHVTGAEAVLADLFDLDLGRCFDVVLAASHLINEGDPAAQAQLLRVCRRHVSGDGVVLVERYPPGWLLDAAPGARDVGPVHVTYEPGPIEGATRHAAVVYRVGTASWRQEFVARDVDDDDLRRLAGAANLRVAGVLDDDATWVRLVPGPD